MLPIVLLLGEMCEFACSTEAIVSAVSGETGFEGLGGDSESQQTQMQLSGTVMRLDSVPAEIRSIGRDTFSIHVSPLTPINCPVRARRLRFACRLLAPELMNFMLALRACVNLELMSRSQPCRSLQPSL